jgi:hypothetical protein
MFVVCVCVVCCQVEVYATSRSLVQRSSTDCDASLCVIKKSRGPGGYSLAGLHSQKKQLKTFNMDNCIYLL